MSLVLDSSLIGWSTGPVSWGLRSFPGPGPFRAKPGTDGHPVLMCHGGGKVKNALLHPLSGATWHPDAGPFPAPRIQAPGWTSRTRPHLLPVLRALSGRS